jgi:dinuclear metal center YbgI/SA1388 family protein
VDDVRRALDEEYPFAHREEWDNVGLLLGDPGAAVRTIAVALTATPAVLAALRRRPADLLVTHHPVVFSPLKSVRPDHPPSSAAYELLRRGVSAISAHTNADAAPRGVSHAMARRLGLDGIRPLLPGEPPSDSCRIVVFVPADRADAVLSAVDAAGGARIGGYSRCSFRSEGTGSFLPSAGTAPFAGVPGREERVGEVRLETVAAGSAVPRVLEAVRDAHPYEEPVVDVIPLRGGALGGGIGAVGELPAPLPLDGALEAVRRAFRPAWIKAAGPRRKTVRRVAVVGGSGGEFLRAAAGSGADLYVTGDVKYHQALEAEAAGMPVADIGHASGERWILPEFRRVLLERFRGAVTVRVIDEKEPLRFVARGDHGEG